MAAFSFFFASALISSVLSAKWIKSDEYGLPYQEQTFKSPPIKLHPGQVANTDPRFFGPFDWPKGPVAIRYFGAEVVDDTDTPVPLSDLYIHHWVMYVNLGKFNWGPCTNIPSTWGIGAEMRGTVYSYPDPYAVVFNGNESVTANLHFIRTQNVSDTQLCIECNCKGSTPSNPMGRIECCPDQSFCWSAQNPTGPVKTYYLKYTLRWTAVDPTVRPLTVYGMDVTMTESVKNCFIEYDIPQENVANGQLDIWQNTTTVPADTGVIFLEVHQHVGGNTFSVEHFRNGQKIADMCDVKPRYGNGTGVGNSDDYVVAIPTCEYNPPYDLKAGDQLRLTSVYNSRHIPNGHPYHEGVMGLVFYYAERRGPTACETQLKTACGNPLPADSQQCLSCARQAYGAGKLDACLKEASVWDKGNGQIRFFCLTDNGVKRPYPIGSEEMSATL